MEAANKLFEDVTSYDFGCYGKLGKICCFCSRKTKFYLQRFNALLLVLQFLLAAGLLSAFYSIAPDMSSGSYIRQGDSVKDILTGYLCFALSMGMFLVCCLGSVTVCLRCYPCVPLLNLITFGAAILLFSAGSLKNAIGEAVDDVCNDHAEEIQEFFNRVVDVPMCSDMCPCDNDAFTAGGYDDLVSLDLQQFSKNEFSLQGDISLNMMFTRKRLDDWLQAGN